MKIFIKQETLVGPNIPPYNIWIDKKQFKLDLKFLLKHNKSWEFKI